MREDFEDLLDRMVRQEPLVKGRTWRDLLRALVPEWYEPEFEGILADRDAVEQAFSEKKEGDK